MSIVSLLGIKVLNNPAKFTDPYEFEITFECLEQLKDDLEWKLTYVGSSRSLEHDQELDSILVGPIPVGINKFILTADAPSPELIPASELVSVTVILLSCSYKEREFVRVGYYVNNEYDSEELRENPPTKVQVDHIVRNILAEKPRVTRFNIVWDNEGEMDDYPPEQGEGEDENGEDIIDMGVDDDEDEEDAGEGEVEEDEDEDEEEEEEEEGEGENDDAEEEERGGAEAEDEEEAEDVEEADEAEEEAEEVEEAEVELIGGSNDNSSKTKNDAELETAKRQNTINDDDIPEIKRQKLNNADEEKKVEEGEEDLEELEEADEEALEKEELEEEEELEQGTEGINKINGKEIGSEPETTAEVEVTEVITTVDQEAETPKIDSAAPTPTESAN